jgi:peptide/nickel transport system substrate-binding protein
MRSTATGSGMSPITPGPTTATRRDFLAAAAAGALSGLAGSGPAAAAADGQLTIGVHISLAPTWFDPAETAGIITPFLVMYALHDAMLKPMPGQNPALCLAESWSATEDGMNYEFVLRKGTTFHNGDPVTAEDVKFSFERYRGAEHITMQQRVVSVEIPDPQRVRFNLKTPWPDFITFYSSATGAGWVVPKKYL